MEHYGKEQRVYHGIWISFICMFVWPIAGFFICFTQINRYSGLPVQVVVNICLGIAGIIGIAFCMICLLSGFVSDLFAAMIRRIKESVTYFKPFTKDSFKWYIYNFFYDGGPIFWIFILVIIFYILVTIYGVSSFLGWYFN